MRGNEPVGSFYPPFANSATSPYEPRSPYRPDSYGSVYNSAMNNSMPLQAWAQPGYPSYQDLGSQHWQSQQSGYDLGSAFQQMSLYGPNPTVPNPYLGSQFVGAHSLGNSQQVPESHHWSKAPNDNYTAYGQNQPAYANSSSFAESAQYGQQYPYGPHSPAMQMSSSRPSNSYYNNPYDHQQFNPQSQSFVPGQQSMLDMRNYAPQLSPNPAVFGTNFAVPQALQRQGSSHSQASNYNPLRPPHQEVGVLRGGQGLTHPLPQPVFSAHGSASLQQPQQYYQNTSRQSSNAQINTAKSTPLGSAESSIAKWGAPASLPAKPPPPMTDSPDTSRLPQNPLLPSFNNPVAASRTSSGGQQFHPLPSVANFRTGNRGTPSPGH